MIQINIPGFATLRLDHLVLDYNGTLAVDGELLEGVSDLLARLADSLHIHIITADTFGNVKKILAGLPCEVHVISAGNEDMAKVDYIEGLGGQSTVSIGNGRNDRLMLRKSALGIAVIQREGASLEAVMAANLVTTKIIDALELLINPDRLLATLRC